MNYNVICEVLKYMPAGEFFKTHIFLNRRVFNDKMLHKHLCKRHLGLVEDIHQETKYIEMFGKQVTVNQYETAAECYKYLAEFTRKSSNKLFLFGF